MKCLVVLAFVVLVAMIVVESAPSYIGCELRAEPGMCKGYFPRLHFNPKSGKCQSFVYGGCGGNENNFKTVQECVERCGGKAGHNVLVG